MSTHSVPAGLDIGPAGPGLVAKLLTVETLQWFSHKGPHSETPVPSGKSDGVLFPNQYHLYHVCGFRLLFLCIPFCRPGVSLVLDCMCYDRVRLVVVCMVVQLS